MMMKQSSFGVLIQTESEAKLHGGVYFPLPSICPSIHIGQVGPSHSTQVADCQHSVTSCSLGNAVAKIRPKRNSNKFDQAVRSILVLSKMFPLILQKHSSKESDQVLDKCTSVLVMGLKETLTLRALKFPDSFPMHSTCFVLSKVN